MVMDCAASSSTVVRRGPLRGAAHSDLPAGRVLDSVVGFLKPPSLMFNVLFPGSTHWYTQFMMKYTETKVKVIYYIASFRI